MNRFRKNNPKHDESPQERPKPLRQFKDDGWQATESAGGGLGARGRLFPFWLVGLLVAVVVLSLVGFVFLYWNDRAAEREPERERSPILRSYGEIDTSDLLGAYLDAMGGRDALQQIRSVRYEGRVIFESAEKDFQMYLLMPDKGMLVTDPGERNSQKLVLNGDIAWQVIEMPDGAREVSRIGEDETRALKWSMRIHNTFREIAMEGRSSDLAVREIEYAGEPCYEVTRESPDGSSFTAVLDRESLYLLKTVETISREGDSDTFTVRYDDYRMVSGVVEPYRTELYRNGDLDNEVLIESIRINSGVMSSLFEIPEEVLD